MSLPGNGSSPTCPPEYFGGVEERLEGAGLDPEVVGRVGRVTVRIRGAGRPGEVSVHVRGATESFIAYCDGEVRRGEPVLIAASRGDRAVEVYPIDQLRLPPRTAAAEES